MQNQLFPLKANIQVGKAVAPETGAAAFFIRQKANNFTFDSFSKKFLSNFCFYWQNAPPRSLG